MSRHPFAEWDPIPGKTGLSMAGGTDKGIGHSTEGGSYAGARGAYVSRGVPPHFTIERTRLIQHIDTAFGSYAMGNSSGGVETNRGGRHVVQVELVGFAGRGFDPATLATFTNLQAWLQATAGIPNAWPAGRPPQTSRSVPPASAAIWTQQHGWFAHCQVPEQEGRWDPGFTDADWVAVSAPLAPAEPPPTTRRHRPMDLDVRRDDDGDIVVDPPGYGITDSPIIYWDAQLVPKGATVVIGPRTPDLGRFQVSVVAAGQSDKPLPLAEAGWGDSLTFTPTADTWVTLVVPERCTPERVRAYIV